MQTRRSSRLRTRAVHGERNASHVTVAGPIGPESQELHVLGTLNMLPVSQNNTIWHACMERLIIEELARSDGL